MSCLNLLVGQWQSSFQRESTQRSWNSGHTVTVQIGFDSRLTLSVTTFVLELWKWKWNTFESVSPNPKRFVKAFQYIEISIIKLPWHFSMSKWHNGGFCLGTQTNRFETFILKSKLLCIEDQRNKLSYTIQSVPKINSRSIALFSTALTRNCSSKLANSLREKLSFRLNW